MCAALVTIITIGALKTYLGELAYEQQIEETKQCLQCLR
jgi:hypothetical protein